jgi:hypothetical protein
MVEDQTRLLQVLEELITLEALEVLMVEVQEVREVHKTILKALLQRQGVLEQL